MPADRSTLPEGSISGGPFAIRRDPAWHWFVVSTKSRHEKQLARALASMGVQFYLPLYRTLRNHGNRTRWVDMALFPGYIFVCVSLANRTEVLATGHVAQFIAVSDQDRLEYELGSIDTAINAGAVFDPCPYLARGRRVRVRSGPFRGVEGIIDTRGPRGRLMLIVQTLGRATSIEINTDLLEAAE